MESFGRALETATGKLFGAKVIGKPVAEERMAISPEMDEKMMQAGEDLGRLLHAAAEGLKAHPLDPMGAVRTAKEHTGDTVSKEEGLTSLSTSILELGGGLAKVAEGVLDQVAPRKKKDDAAG